MMRLLVDWHGALRDSGRNERRRNRKGATDDDNGIANLVLPARNAEVNFELRPGGRSYLNRRLRRIVARILPLNPGVPCGQGPSR